MSGAIGNPTLVTVATINSGATPVQVDVRVLGNNAPVNVTLSTDYAMLNPPGYPFRPQFTGTGTPQFPHVILSGSTVAMLQCEAVAIVAAGAGTLA